MNWFDSLSFVANCCRFATPKSISVISVTCPGLPWISGEVFGFGLLHLGEEEPGQVAGYAQVVFAVAEIPRINVIAIQVLNESKPIS